MVRSIPERRTGGRRGTALSIEEFRRFLQGVERLSGAGISEDVARLLLVIAWTGLRKGEASALRWSDLVDSELHVTRSVWRRREKAQAVYASVDRRERDAAAVAVVGLVMGEGE